MNPGAGGEKGNQHGGLDRIEGNKLRAVGQDLQRKLRADWANGGRGRASQEEETTKAKAQRRWGPRVKGIESQHRNLTRCVRSCHVIRSLKSEERL